MATRSDLLHAAAPARCPRSARHRRPVALFPLSLSLLALAFAAVATFKTAAQTSTRLAFDTFTGADLTRLAAHAPDINQIGGAWTLGTLGPFPDARAWGYNTDTPVPGDYDGDGKVDPAIYRPSTGVWAILKSSTNYTRRSLRRGASARTCPCRATTTATARPIPRSIVLPTGYGPS